ncbi:MAG: type II toxin-antitoxin system RelE/ParE family toxin [Oscillatoriales cyanobacterium]|jgi:mRNA-degrading endonuclease RelE of RelBE toxin-antitoxin system|nr:MAG: type II toxin-antitoxin system RelE/ParE family toxin [Oscillatoriales cyanobacterium]
MYEITYTRNALKDLQYLRKFEQKLILDEIDNNLKHQPTQPTRNRKPMRPNPYAEWELRIGNFRVLYNVEDDVKIVEIQNIGQKRGNQFFFRDEGADDL